MKIAVIITNIVNSYKGLWNSFLKSEGRFPQSILYSLRFVEDLELYGIVDNTLLINEEYEIKFRNKLEPNFDLVIDSFGLNPQLQTRKWCAYNSGWSNSYESVNEYELSLFMTNQAKEGLSSHGYDGNYIVVNPICHQVQAERLPLTILFCPTTILNQCNVLCVLLAFQKVQREYPEVKLFLVCPSWLNDDYDREVFSIISKSANIFLTSYYNYYDWLRIHAQATIAIDLDLHASWYANYSLTQGAITIVRKDHGFENIDNRDLVTIEPTQHYQAIFDEKTKSEELATQIIEIFLRTDLRNYHQYLREKYGYRFHPFHATEQLRQVL